MANTRAFLKDATTRHAIYLQRFAGSQIKEVEPFLDAIKADILRELARVDITTVSRSRLATLLRTLDRDISRTLKDMSKLVKSNMKEFGKYEADFSVRMFEKATVDVTFKTPTASVLQAAIFDTPTSIINDKKITVDGMLNEFNVAKKKEVSRLIRTGIVAGKTSIEMAAAVEQVAKLQASQAASLVRTITNQVSSAARDIVMQENEDIIEGYEWVSTLDSATTFTCQSLDGQVFKQGQGPMPPQHYGCRSTTIPRVKKEYSVSDLIARERPAIGPDGVERVDARTKYNSWLKKQPASFQDDVLGPTRAKLFRQGGLNASSFVDNNYEKLTLEQLKRKEPQAFKRAGLNE